MAVGEAVAGRCARSFGLVDDGFEVLPSIAGGAEIERLRTVFDEVLVHNVLESSRGTIAIEARALDEADARLRNRAWILLAQGDVYERFASTPVVDATVAHLRSSLGLEAALYEMQLIYKPPRHGAATVWHQDEAYGPAPKALERVTLWLPLQDVGTWNGCMSFVPGTHRGRLRPHRPTGMAFGDNPDVLQLEGAPAAETVVACPLAVGEATLHLPRTLHYSAPNASGDGRRALVMDFMLSRSRLHETMDRHLRM